MWICYIVSDVETAPVNAKLAILGQLQLLILFDKVIFLRKIFWCFLQKSNCNLCIWFKKLINYCKNNIYELKGLLYILNHETCCLWAPSMFLVMAPLTIEFLMYLTSIQIVLNHGYHYINLVICGSWNTLPDNFDLVVLLKQKTCLPLTKI